MTICPKCHQALRAEPQLKYVKVNGQWTTQPGTTTYTCFNRNCNREGITLNLDALQALTDEQAARYPRKFIDRNA
jgi:hypothetical protein